MLIGSPQRSSFTSNLAAQLPPEIAPYVQGVGGGESFSVTEFYDRVAQKEGVGHDEAVRHARAVATDVQSAVTGGELDHLRSQLENEYRSSSANRALRPRKSWSATTMPTQRSRRQESP